MSARIGVDATGWLNPRGAGRFTRSIVTRLVERDRGNTFVLYADARTCEVGRLPRGAEVRPVALRQTPGRAAGADSRRAFGDLVRLTLSVRPADLDLFIFASVQTYFPVLGVPTVVGVHDTIAHDLPGLTLATRSDRAAWTIKEQLAIRTARTIFTVSEAARDQLERRYGLAAADIPIVPEAPDAVFAPRSPDELATVLGPLGLAAGSYFVFAGGISPHKNIGTLLSAFARLPAGEATALVLVGDLTADPYLSAAGEVRRQLTVLGLEDRVLLPGFVSDEQLACLFAGSRAAVLPSLAEGFGLPAVEAAACGVPVILSDLPAHRETLGDAGIYFPPRDVDGLADAMLSVLTDPARAGEAGARARVAASRLSWDSAADRLADVLRDALR